METKEVTTRFMRGYRTEEVFSILENIHGAPAVYTDEIDWNEAIFSRNFIAAIEQDDMVPILGSHRPAHESRFGDAEYHHLIHEGECYSIYFEKA